MSFKRSFEAGKCGLLADREGSLFQEVGPETEKARGPKVLSLVRGVRRMRGSDVEQRVREGV